jgi:hypothetical protein
MRQPRPTDPIGSIGWTERTGGVLTARGLNRDTTNGLSSYSKAELVDLAAGFRIRGRSSMTKDELVTALTTASRER